MIYKNSVRVLLNNFSVVWKELLYLLLTLVVVGLLTSALALPVVNMLTNAGWVQECSSLIETVYTSPKDFSTAFTSVATNLLLLLKNNFASLWLYYLLIIFVVIFVPLVMCQMSYYTTSEVIEGKMSSITRLGFVNTFIARFYKSVKFAFVKIIASIPFYAGYALAVFVYVLVAKNWLVSIVLFPILIMLLVFVASLKCTIFSCFTGELIYNKKRSAWKCLFKSIKKVGSHFGSILSNAVCVCLTFVTLNILIGIFTLGAGLLVSVPASIVWICSFNLTTYFVIDKKRFYVSENMIIDPN